MAKGRGAVHMGRVAQMPCALCWLAYGVENGPVEVHHIREEQGAAQRASDFLTVPLCVEHHRGASGVHGLGVRGFYTRYKLTELDLLAETIRRLN